MKMSGVSYPPTEKMVLKNISTEGYPLFSLLSFLPKQKETPHTKILRTQSHTSLRESKLNGGREEVETI